PRRGRDSRSRARPENRGARGPDSPTCRGACRSARSCDTALSSLALPPWVRGRHRSPLRRLCRQRVAAVPLRVGVVSIEPSCRHRRRREGSSSQAPCSSRRRDAPVIVSEHGRPSIGRALSDPTSARDRARRSPTGALTGSLALLLAVLAVHMVAANEEQVIAVEDWSRQPVGTTGIPDGWKGQSWGQPKYDFAIVSDGGRRALRLRSQNDNSTITREVVVDVKRFPYLAWRWKAVTLPKGGDSRRRDRDDQAAQIYVAFPRFPTTVRSRIVGYVWDTTAPIGTIAKSEGSSMVTYVVVRSGEADLGRWISETRNVYDDYLTIYGEAPTEDLRAVSLAIDSNDTHSSAESYFGEILFRRR